MSQTVEERICRCLKLKDAKYYLEYRSYFDVAGLVHSVVLTKQGDWVLRVFRGHTEFRPEKYFSFFPAPRNTRRTSFVNQNIFKSYIVKPDIHIGKVVATYGSARLLEIVVYDEHREILKNFYSGEYIAVQNVHYWTKTGLPDTLMLHGGGEKFNRGISKIPDDFEGKEFYRLEDSIHLALSRVSDYEGFVEFVEEVHDAPTLPKSLENVAPENFEFAKPWNKIVLGETIAVDYFIKSSKCKYHFLTHAHSDHCRGIDAKFKHKIYCSEKTAEILPIILGLQPDEVPGDWIIPMKENTPVHFDDFSVTLIDANHVHGAVMFVFEGPLIERIAGDGVGRILCTGDFRAESGWIENMRKQSDIEWFFTSKYSDIYLDNTYFSVDEKLKFLTWLEAAELMKQHLSEHSTSDFYIPLHRLGRENLLEKVAREIGEPIELYEEKERVAGKITCSLGLNKKKDRTIRVVKRSVWRGPVPEGAFVMEITQLHHLTGTKHADNVIHIPYSDHSSHQEILNFLSHFEYAAIYPSSKRYSKNDLKALMRAGRGFTETNLEKQLKLHTFIGPAKKVQARPDSAPDSAPKPQPSTSSAPPQDPIVQEEKSRSSTSTSQDPTMPEESSCKKSVRNPLPPGVAWQDDEYDYMSGDLDSWPEGPPASVEEAIYRMTHRRRRRLLPNVPIID